MPALLTETLFISNPNEAQLLTTEPFLEMVAQAHAVGLDKQGVVDRLELREKKTQKKRTIALSKKTSRLIARYIDKERPAICYDEPIFRSQKGGKAISRQHAYTILNDAARSVGITERIGTHSLRKTFGYFAYKQGIDLAMIQKLLNHSSQTETLRYIGITQEQMDEVVLKLDL